MYKITRDTLEVISPVSRKDSECDVDSKDNIYSHSVPVKNVPDTADARDSLEAAKKHKVPGHRSGISKGTIFEEHKMVAKKKMTC